MPRWLIIIITGMETLFVIIDGDMLYYLKYGTATDNVIHISTSLYAVGKEIPD